MRRAVADGVRTIHALEVSEMTLIERWMRFGVLAGLVCAALTGGAQRAHAASSRACAAITNPYPGTRYDGVGLTHIQATGVSCVTARRVARRAHFKALGLPRPESGVRRFTWNGWRVTGDLRSASDHYVAVRGALRVRWRF
jgi:hypothetical protein